MHSRAFREMVARKKREYEGPLSKCHVFHRSLSLANLHHLQKHSPRERRVAFSEKIDLRVLQWESKERERGSRKEENVCRRPLFSFFFFIFNSHLLPRLALAMKCASLSAVTIRFREGIGGCRVLHPSSLGC